MRASIAKKMIRQTTFAALGLMLSVVSAAQAAVPEVLNQVPSDAYGVIVVGNPRTFANKISNAATRLKAPLPVDVLGTVTRSIGITSGFDANGSAALVLLKPAPGSLHDGSAYFDGLPPAVLLIPSSNPSLMLEKFNPEAADKDGISAVTLPEDPEEKGFSAVVDKKWVALAQKKSDLAAYLARGDSFAKTASADTLKAFETNDMVIWGNVEKLGMGVDKMIDEQHSNLVGMRDLEAFVNGEDALSATLQKHGMSAVFDLGKEFFHDAGASMVTVRLTDSGATVGLVAEFKEGTPMGKFVAAQGDAGSASLKGLPSGNYLVAGSGKWNSEAMADVFRSVMGQILNDPALAKDEHLADLKQSLNAVGQMVQITNGANFMFLVPPKAGADGYINGALVIETPDPKKFMDLENQMAGKVLEQTSTGDIKTSVTVTPNALTVKDVQLMKMNIKLALRDETADKPIPEESKAALEAAKKMYGPNGMTIYMGVVGQKVIAVYGSDLSLIESAIAAVQSDGDALTAMPEVAATKEQLVEKPIAVLYLPIARWASLAMALEMGGDMPVPAAGNANTPPVVVSMGVSGRMVTAEVHVPIATILATQEAMNPPVPGRGGRVQPNLP